jgi:hypothetical protein
MVKELGGAHLLRFLQDDVGLYAQYQRNIHTMVIYGAGISSAPETLIPV